MKVEFAPHRGRCAAGVVARVLTTFEKEGVRIRVVAGKAEDVSGPVTDIAASPLYIDVELAPCIDWQFPIPEGHTLITYVFEGEGSSPVKRWRL